MEKEITVTSSSDSDAEVRQAAFISSEDLAAGELPELENEGPNYDEATLAEMGHDHAERMSRALENYPDAEALLASVGNESIPLVAVIENENSAAIVLHLATNQRDLRHLQELQASSPAKAKLWIEKLGDRLQPADLNYREFQKEREKQERRRRRDR